MAEFVRKKYLQLLETHGDDAESCLHSLKLLADWLLGPKLFTVMDIDIERQVGKRIYTSMPDAYPLLGEKPLPEGPWTDTVITNRAIFLANDIKAIAEVFFDHEMILSLGCESVINLPVIVHDQVIGCVNSLDGRAAYHSKAVDRARLLEKPAAASIMRNRQSPDWLEYLA